MTGHKTKTNNLVYAQDSIARPFNTAPTVTNAKNPFTEPVDPPVTSNSPTPIEQGKTQSHQE